MTATPDISPSEAAALAAKGARIVDIREPQEWASGVIPGAARAPLSVLQSVDIGAQPQQTLIFHCKGGARTRANDAALRAKAEGHDVYLMQGGIDGWRAAGLPVAQG